MKICSFLLLGLLLLTGGKVNAQTACPPGMTPYGTGVCGYDNSQQQEPPAPQQEPLRQSPPQQWEDRWGAIATYEPGGVLGAATDMQSESEAKQSAMADCQAKGGGSNCELQISYRNGCAVLLVGDKFFNAASAESVEKATQSGMKVCTANGNTNCHIYYTACSLPIRIQ